MTGVSLKAENLRYVAEPRPGAQPILELASLAAPAGSLTILSGASGSGKSSLLYLLSGLLPASQGSITWGATDITTLGEADRDAWRRANAGFVFQNFNLIPEMTPLDNVLVSVWFAHFSAAALRARALQLLDALEVPQHRKNLALLSRGEQQRVAIARALLHDPAVIFADEPTASLDANSGALVAGILKNLAVEQGRTVVIASHDPVIIGLADATIALDHGHLSLRPAA